MAAINVAHLELYLSGGAANMDPDASLGGAVSGERVASQSASGISNISGVTIDYAAGNPEGAGTLEYFSADDSFIWTPFGSSAGDPVIVTEDGRYAVRGSIGMLSLEVDFSALPVGDESDTITVANIANETFDDVAKSESFNGDVEYRCIYLKNGHQYDPFFDAVVYIGQQPTPGAIAIGADPCGAGDAIERAVDSITRSGSTATVTTSSAHGFQAGYKIRIRGADQSEYNGVKTIFNVTSNTFDFTVSGTPTSPATGTIVCGWGMAALVLDEGVAPSGVTFTAPSTSEEGISLGQLDSANSAAIWIQRTIPLRNTVANPESVSLLAFQSFF